MKKIVCIALTLIMALSSVSVLAESFTLADSYEVGERSFNGGKVTLEAAAAGGGSVTSDVYAGEEGKDYTDFNAINRETRDVDEEWVDFPGEYHMGIERYFHYYTEPQLRDLIQQAGFEVLDFHLEGGEKHNKWLVFALEKPRG